MNIQRIRNLTTGKLHTKMAHIYQDIEYIVGSAGLMTHMIPRANRAIRPWLQEKVKEERFWDGQNDPTHIGELDLPPMNEEEQKEFWDRYSKLPSLLGQL